VLSVEDLLLEAPLLQNTLTCPTLCFGNCYIESVLSVMLWRLILPLCVKRTDPYLLNKNGVEA